MRIAAAIFLLVSTAFAQGASPLAKATAACGPTKTQFEEDLAGNSRPDAKIEADKALVYVLEDQRSLGDVGEVTVKVGMDGAWIGANQNNTYLSFAVLPGEHHLCVNWQSRVSSRNQQFGLAHFTAEAGKVYYFRTKVVTAHEYESLDLEAVDSDEGQYLIALAPSNRLHEKH